MEYRFILTYNSVSTEVGDPLGWQNAQFEFKRDENWHGVFSEYTINGLEWTCEAKDILLSAYAAAGVNAEVGVLIQYRCSRTNVWLNFLQGQINIGTLQLLDGENTARADIITESVAQRMRARYDMPVDLNSLVTKDGTAIAQYTNGKWPVRINSEQGLPIRKMLAGVFDQGCIDYVPGDDSIFPWFLTFPAFDTYVPAWNSGTDYEPCMVVYHPAYDENWRAKLASVNIEPGVAVNWATYWESLGEFLDKLSNASVIAQLVGKFADFGCCSFITPGRSIPGGGIGCSDSVHPVWIVPRMGVVNDEFEDGVNREITVAGYFTDRTDLISLSLTADGTNTATAPTPLFIAPKTATYTVNFECELDIEALLVTHTVATICDCDGVDYDTENDFCEFKIEAFRRVSGVDTSIWGPFTVESVHGGDAYVDNMLHYVATAAINLTGTYDMQAGEEFTFYFAITVTSLHRRDALSDVLVQHGIWFKYTADDCCFQAFYDDAVEFPAGTTIPVYMPHEAANRIVESITNLGATVESDFLGRPDAEPVPTGGAYADYGCGSLQAVTNGLLIRGFDFENNDVPNPSSCAIITPGSGGDTPVSVKGIFVSLKDFFDVYDAINNIGMGVIEDPFGIAPPVVVIEPKEYFYQDTVVLNISMVDKQLVGLTRSIDNDAIINEFATGYDKFEGESINGQFEFNTARLYKTTVQKIRKRLEKVCKAIASGYTFELTRRQNIANSGSADWRYDDDLFIVCMNDTGDGTGMNALPELTIGGTPANILNPVATMNYRISPWKMVWAWLSWIGRSGYPSLNTAIAFTSGKANYVTEGADPSNALLPDSCDIGQRVDNATQLANTGRVAVFAKPEIVTFGVSLTLADVLAIRANPHGVIRLTEPTRVTDYWIKSLKYKLEDAKCDLELIPKI